MSKTIISNDNAGTVIAPESQGTVVTPSQQGTVVAPSGTTVAPSGTVVASGGTVVAGTGTSVQKESAMPSLKKGAKMNFRMQPGEQIMLSGKAYTIVKGVSSGTEAELYVVNDGSRDYAAKIYNRGFSPNAKILPDVMSIKDDDFIVHIYQSGIADIAGESLSYVLMDYCGYGATSNYSYKNNVGELLEIALQGAMALDTCHKNHILHKDIKPANILVKKRGPIEICLCDFGIADKLDKKEISTSQSRTVIYAAPEMYTTGMVIDGRTYCKLSAASDFYALGMSLLSLWVGEAKFNASEIDLAYQKKEGSLVIPRDMPATLANIVKGLTNPEPGKRWGLNEIDKELTDVLLNINQTGDSQGILYDVPNNIIIKDLEDLANYLQTHADSAKRLLYRGKLSALLKSSYPELSQDLTNIVETKYTSDQASGLAAAVFAINPNVAINLRGKKNDTGRNESKALNTIKEVSDFCCSHRELDKDSKLFLLSDTFVSWLRARDANVARAVSSLSRLSGDSDYNREFNYRLIIQTIDPFADFNLCNDINDPHYAMTGAGIAWYINEAFNLYFSGEKSSSAQLSKLMVELLVKSFDKQMTTHKTSYLINSLKTKGKRFDDQIKWINYCTDTEPDVGLEYMPEVAMMKAVAGLGMTPTYHFFSIGKTISSLDEFHNIPQKDLKDNLNNGLIGWLAVQYQENPGDKSLTKIESYKGRLYDFLYDILSIDNTVYQSISNRMVGISHKDYPLLELNPSSPLPINDASGKPISTINDFVLACMDKTNSKKELLMIMKSSAFSDCWVSYRDNFASTKLNNIKYDKFLSANSKFADELFFRNVLFSLDSSLDVNLCTDSQSDSYIKSPEQLGLFLNKVFSVFYTLYNGDSKKVITDWDNHQNVLYNISSPETILLVIDSFKTNNKSDEGNYLISSLKNDFNIFASSIDYIKQYGEDTKEIGPSYTPSIGLLKVAYKLQSFVKYHFYENNIDLISVADLSSIQQDIKFSNLKKGLREWIAVQFHENPNHENYNRNEQLFRYLYAIGDIDKNDTEYVKVKESENAIYEDYMAVIAANKNIGFYRFVSTYLLSFNLILFIPLIAFMIEYWSCAHPFFDHLTYLYEIPLWIYPALDMIIVFFILIAKRRLVSTSRDGFNPNTALYYTYGKDRGIKSNSTKYTFGAMKTALVFDGLFVLWILFADPSTFLMIAAILILSFIPTIIIK